MNRECVDAQYNLYHFAIKSNVFFKTNYSLTSISFQYAHASTTSMFWYVVCLVCIKSVTEWSEIKETTELVTQIESQQC